MNSVRNLQRATVLAKRNLSTSASRKSFARLTICGNLIKSPEKGTDKNGKPFYKWTVATDEPVKPNADGTYPEKKSTFHNVFQYFGAEKDWQANVPKGSLVLLDCNYKYSSDKQEDGSYKESVFLSYDRSQILKRPRTEDAGFGASGSGQGNLQDLFGGNKI